jgi:hypothetical protein
VIGSRRRKLGRIGLASNDARSAVGKGVAASSRREALSEGELVGFVGSREVLVRRVAGGKVVPENGCGWAQG